MKTTLFCLSIIIFLFSACDKESETYALKKQDLMYYWEFDHFENKTTGETEDLPDNYRAGITFHGEDCLEVAGPCNVGPGKYELNANKLKITSLSMTERGCNILGYEEIFTENLSGTYNVSGDKLIIDSDGDYNLSFTRTDSIKEYECYDF